MDLHLRQDLLVIRLQRPANCTGPPLDNTLNRGSKLKYPMEKTTPNSQPKTQHHISEVKMDCSWSGSNPQPPTLVTCPLREWGKIVQAQKSRAGQKFARRVRLGAKVLSPTRRMQIQDFWLAATSSTAQVLTYFHGTTFFFSPLYFTLAKAKIFSFFF